MSLTRKANFKKLEKKHQRLKSTIFKTDEVKISSSWSQHLVIANGGLGNGVSKEELACVYASFGIISSIVMIPRKSYAFVSFLSVETAAKAQKDTDGVTFSDIGGGVTLFVLFVEEVPEQRLKQVDLPTGLTVIEDYITEAEEVLLLKCVTFSDQIEKDFMKNRKVHHFGYEFSYTTNNIIKDKPLEENIPSSCVKILHRLQHEGHIHSIPDQLTVNQYLPGQGIPSHIDTHSACDDTIISVSLGSQVLMDFKDPNGEKASVLLPRRSVLIMRGEARYCWQHAIVPRKMDVVQHADNGLTLIHRSTRTSFTFRTIIRGPCTCAYKEQCDSQMSRNPMEDSTSILPQTSEQAKLMEESHVHQVYDNIAEHFSETRYNRWPQVVEFLNSLQPGSVVADVGCGNGKYLGTRKDIFMFGCDRSIGLCEICCTQQYHIHQADCLALPIRSNSCDACISIAVIHHLSLQSRRLSAIKELIRILRFGGRALIYVWAMEQEKDGVKSNYLKDKECMETAGAQVSSEEDNEQSETSSDTTRIPVHVNRTPFKSSDMLVPWHLKNKAEEATQDVHYRYYHMFRDRELQELVSHVDGVSVCKSYYDKGNWCVILQKDRL